MCRPISVLTGAWVSGAEGHVAPAVPEQAPGRDPLADLDPGVGIHPTSKESSSPSPVGDW